MITMSFDYESCVRASEKISWKLDEVFPPGMKLDFERRFLPDSMLGIDGLAFLSEHERLKLNQIMGNSYLHLFYFVEEYIIASVLQHANAEIFGEPSELRALLRFADEEVKHQLLFQRFRAAFERDFGAPCDVIENPEAVAEVILSKSPMAVLLTTLHLELLTQQHFVEGFREGAAKELDPLFASLLKNHWLEEAQHAKIDALELKKLADISSEAQLEAALADYLGILEAFAGLLGQQARLDVNSLERAVGRTFDDAQRAAISEAQTHAYRRAFIVMGIENAGFQRYLSQFHEHALPRVTAQIGALS
ncbi:Hypothetical protein A7982_05878 [Minicystis rosea]|nr:Hypothetical protein A7982_05878 [Minicystis rosea]